jgi:hypothetical protein
MGEQYEQTRSLGHALLHFLSGGVRYMAVLRGESGSGNVHPPVSGHSVSFHGEQAQTGVTLVACKLQTDCCYGKKWEKTRLAMDSQGKV